VRLVAKSRAERDFFGSALAPASPREPRESSARSRRNYDDSARCKWLMGKKSPMRDPTCG